MRRDEHRNRWSADIERSDRQRFAEHAGKQSISKDLELERALLAKAERERGKLTGWAHRLRLWGIRSAVNRGVVGNSAWGLSLARVRGGQALSMHGRHIQLQTLARGRALQARRRAEQASGGATPPAVGAGGSRP